MFVVHNDMTIYATRGDVVYFPVEKKVGDAKYLFQAGDIVRIKICEKKNYSKVFLLKDFVVEESTTSVSIFLSKWEMKFGPIIHKATDYWYEVELNPDTYPDTFIGHNENGPAIFKLFPEAKDVVEGEIPNPEENAAVSRMVVHFVNEYLGDKADTIIQEILKEEYIQTVINEILKEENIESIIREILKEGNVETIVKEIIQSEGIETIVQEIIKTENVGTIVQEIVKTENVETIVQEIVKPGNVETIVQEIIREENIETIVREILQPEHTETIVQEIIKEENIGTIVQEIVKPGNVETIIQEITKPEHTQTIVQEVLKPENTTVIVQEILKPENTQVIVEQVLDAIPVQMLVEVDISARTASHTSTQIKEHLNGGGTAAIKTKTLAYGVLQGVNETSVIFRGIAEENGQVQMFAVAIFDDATVATNTLPIGGTDGKTFSNIKITEHADGSVTMYNTFTDGTDETIAIGAGDTPGISYNGVAIPTEWVSE